MQTPAFAGPKTVRTWKLFRGLICVVAVMAVCLCPALALGQTNSSWNGGTGNWSDLGNWNPAAVPNNSGTTTYDVKIGAANSNVTMDVLNDTIDNLTLAAKNSLTINAGDNLRLVSGTSLNADTINTMGVLKNDVGGTFTNAATITSTAASGTLVNGGTFTNTGTISNVTVSNDDFPMLGGTFTNDGTITSTSGTGNLSNTGTFINNGTISNVTISNANFPMPDALFTNNGRITTADNSTLFNIEFASFTNNGEITIVSTSELLNGASFQNFGTINNNGQLNNFPGTINDGQFLNMGTINNNAGASIGNAFVNTIDNGGVINNAWLSRD